MFGNPKVTNLNIFALFYPSAGLSSGGVHRSSISPDTDGLLVLKLLN